MTHTYTATFDPAVESIEDLANLPTGRIGDGDEREDNRIRAAWAGHAVVAFVDMVGDAGELESSISDLLGDLMHLCDALNINFDYMIEQGRRHYTAELRGEF